MTRPLLRSYTGHILIESHRGCEARAPENSWTGIRLAQALGADQIEVDVQVSSDGVPFLHHNRRLPDGRVATSLDWAALDQVRIARASTTCWPGRRMPARF